MAEFCTIVNNWFDVCNVRHLGNYYPLQRPFGFKDCHESQMEALNAMSEMITNVRAIGTKHNGLQIYQKGILQSNNALIGLYDYVHEKFGAEYILTSRLNQDCLESFFPL